MQRRGLGVEREPEAERAADTRGSPGADRKPREGESRRLLRAENPGLLAGLWPLRAFPLGSSALGLSWAVPRATGETVGAKWRLFCECQACIVSALSRARLRSHTLRMKSVPLLLPTGWALAGVDVGDLPSQGPRREEGAAALCPSGRTEFPARFPGLGAPETLLQLRGAGDPEASPERGRVTCVSLIGCSHLPLSSLLPVPIGPLRTLSTVRSLLLPVRS